MYPQCLRDWRRAYEEVGNVDERASIWLTKTIWLTMRAFDEREFARMRLASDIPVVSNLIHRNSSLQVEAPTDAVIHARALSGALRMLAGDLEPLSRLPVHNGNEICCVEHQEEHATFALDEASASRISERQSDHSKS